MSRRGFTLVELILAIFILGIGMVSVAALFPVGLAQQQATEDEVYGPVVARHAMELLRSRLRQEDFGAFEDFSDPLTVNVTRDPVPLQQSSPNPLDSQGFPRATTISGDWSWKRPGLCLKDDTDTADVDEAGMMDVFSGLYTRLKVARSWSGMPQTSLVIADFLTEFPDGIPYNDSAGNQLYGIPYRRDLYDQQRDIRQVNYQWRVGGRKRGSPGFTPPGLADGSDRRNVVAEPLVLVSQRERYWPAPSNPTGPVSNPKYVWDCMFRRKSGRVQVAVFVYRVSAAFGIRGGNGSTGTPYVVASADGPLQAILSDPALLKGRPSIPQWTSARLNSHLTLFRGTNPFGRTPWGAGGYNGKVGTPSTLNGFTRGADDLAVPNTQGDGTSELPLDLMDSWQSPGQWLVDMMGHVHRVTRGRRFYAEGPVMLANPVPREPYADANFDMHDRVILSAPQPSDQDAILATPGSGGDSRQGILDLWFVPTEDANGNVLVPVYAAVEDL